MEKKTEELLYIYLSKWKCDCDIFHSITENEDVHIIFKHASKTQDSSFSGYPDRIYYNKSHLIIFECKPISIHKCENDLNIYKSKIDIDFIKKNNIIVFYCAFSGTTESDVEYQFYDDEMNKIKRDFTLESLGIILKKDIKSFDIFKMEKFCHKFNNDIRNKTKLNDCDKPLFIAFILLSFTNDEFRKIFENSIEPKMDVILINIMLAYVNKIKNFGNSFDFITTHLDNNKLFEFCQKIYTNIICENYDIDVLNYFYSEFVSYQNTDSKSLGIVLTPDHIVNLMIDILNIKKTDIFLDICSGTGSFLVKSLKYSPKKIIGCEYQNKLCLLTEINIILRNFKKYKIFNGDCFDYSVKASKSAINPPYSTKPNTELCFVIKQLNSVCNNGLVSAIIPIGKLTNNSANNKLKQKIYEIATIKCIIKCNSQLFVPAACVDTCIILLKKSKGHKQNDKVLFIDYSKDELETEKHLGKKKTFDFKTKYNRIIDIVKTRKETDISYLSSININDDWLYIERPGKIYINKKTIELEKLLIEQAQKVNALELEISKNKIQDLIVFKKEREYKFCDLFDIFKGKKIIKKCINGEYPLIGASKFNNGVVSNINEFSFENAITISTNGSVGESFYHDYKFDTTSDVCVLIPKKDMFILNKKIGSFLCLLFKTIGKKYSYSFKWNMTRMKKDIVILPINDNDTIDFKFIETFYE